MPKRTNPFQHMMYILSRLLHDESWIVRESVLLEDRVTTTPREIDILIEGQVGPVPIKIGVECIDFTRPADVKWIESMLTKHADIKTDKLIAVSRSGFTKAALSKAEHHGIIAASLMQADKSFWVGVLHNLKTLTMDRIVLSNTQCDGAP